MKKLSRNDLYPLEHYSEIRDEFRHKIMAHKNSRRLMLGDVVMLLFEDRLLTQYQIQEMLRIEKIFDAAAIEEELAAYNPLIPDGSNWKATMMIQYGDADERRRQLRNLKGIEDRVWMQVENLARIYAIADEDLERSNEEKTSAVHFLRFELDANMIAAVKSGGSIRAGINHAHYQVETDPLPERLRLALLGDIK